MSRSRTLIVGACVLATVVAVGSLARAQDSDMQSLVQKIEALEKRLSNMERNLTQKLSNIERQLAQGGGAAAAAHPLEGEATAKFGEINRLVSAGDLTKAKTEMDAFMKKYGATATAKKAGRLNSELSVIGKGRPENWGIEKWFQGESEVDLNSDKCTLLVFWETWCPHCQREVPKLQAIYDSLKGEGLQVVGLTKITKSATEEKVADFIKQRGMTYPVAKENGAATQHFGVSGVPAAAVVKEGKVIWRGHPARLSQDQLKKWL